MTKKEKELKCGVIMPITPLDGYPASHWNEVLQIIKEALIDSEFNIQLVSESNESGIIHKRIIQNIYDNEIIICDVSGKNPNVMFELGIRLAFDKPAIIIKDEITSYSFDTAPIEHLQYPSNLNYHSIQNFKNLLKVKVEDTYNASKEVGYTTFLKHFGQFVVAKIDEKTVEKDEYLLQVISEIRKDINTLSRKINTKESNSFVDMVNKSLLNEHASAYSFPAAKGLDFLSPTEFIEKKLKMKRLKFTEEKTIDENSKIFKELWSEYRDCNKFCVTVYH